MIVDIYFIDLNSEQIIFSVPINDIDTKNITNGALMYDDDESKDIYIVYSNSELR